VAGLHRGERRLGLAMFAALAALARLVAPRPPMSSERADRLR